MNKMLERIIRKQPIRTRVNLYMRQHHCSVNKFASRVKLDRKKFADWLRRNGEISDADIMKINMEIGNETREENEDEHDEIDIKALVRATRIKTQISYRELAYILGVKEQLIRNWNKYGYPRWTHTLMEALCKELEKGTSQKTKTTLIRLRVNTGMSLERAAEEIGISPEKLWRIEWKNSVPYDLRERVAIAYKEKEERIPVTAQVTQKTSSKVIIKNRKQRGIKISELEEKSGIKNNRYRGIENGTSTPTYAEAARIAKVLGYKTAEDMLVKKDSGETADNGKIVPNRNAVEYYRKQAGCSVRDLMKEAHISYKTYIKNEFSRQQVRLLEARLGVSKDELMQPPPSTVQEKKEKKINTAAMKEARKKSRLTQAQCAKRAGISVSYYSQIESGRKIPPEHMLNKIARQINRSADSLIL